MGGSKNADTPMKTDKFVQRCISWFIMNYQSANQALFRIFLKNETKAINQIHVNTLAIYWLTRDRKWPWLAGELSFQANNNVWKYATCDSVKFVARIDTVSNNVSHMSSKSLNSSYCFLLQFFSPNPMLQCTVMWALAIALVNCAF